MDDIILVKDLPPTFVAAAARDLAAYTVAFVRVQDAPDGRRASLLGSGVLVSAGGIRAILTAQHVIRVLPKSGRLCVLLERTPEPHSIDTTGLAFLEIARGGRESEGPDLGAVILAPQIAASIAAKKSFVTLDAKREQMLGSPPEIDDGVWFAQGFLEERTVVTLDADRRGRTTGFFNFTGVGGPDKVINVGEHDYFEFPVDFGARAVAPRSWGGMSGGGLWQVPIRRVDGGLIHGSPLLSGLLFYQHPTSDSTCGVRGHGRRSLYLTAYNAILGREP